jgi:hypothetical protein
MSLELPESCVLLNNIQIFEYLDEDSEVSKFAVFEGSDGSEMPLDRILLLLEWAKALALAPLTAQLIADSICTCEDEDAHDDDF